jgi:outer membrane protein TolC
VNQNEVVGGIQLEYSRPLDTRGDDAALYQAQLERDIAIQNRKQITDDLHYDAASRLGELKAIQATIKAYRLSVNSERAKLDEAERRYRQGRITIDQVIQFENQTAASELGLVLQRIDYQRSLIALELLRGTLWNSIDITAIEQGDTRP